jgi:hypothetical protein
MLVSDASKTQEALVAESERVKEEALVTLTRSLTLRIALSRILPLTLP